MLLLLSHASSSTCSCRALFFFLPHLFRSRNHGGEAHAGDTPSELARSATGLFLEKRVIKKKKKVRRKEAARCKGGEGDGGGKNMTEVTKDSLSLSLSRAPVHSSSPYSPSRTLSRTARAEACIVGWSRGLTKTGRGLVFFSFSFWILLFCFL